MFLYPLSTINGRLPPRQLVHIDVNTPALETAATAACWLLLLLLPDLETAAVAALKVSVYWN